MDHNHSAPEQAQTGFWKSRSGLALIAFLAIGLFYLYSEHRAHLFGVVPYLLILACPLLHIFMHRGHGKH